MDLQEIKSKLNEAISNNPSKAFPEMEFSLRGRKWVSRYRLHGQDPGTKKDRCYIEEGQYSIGENTTGNPTISFTDYLLEKEGYSRDTKGTAFWSVLTKYCSLYGIEVQLDEETAQRMREKARRKKLTEDINSRMVNALQAHKTQYSKEVYEYLINVRGCKEFEPDLNGNPVNVIKEMELGFSTPQDVWELISAIGSNFNNIDSMGKSHVLSLPCRDHQQNIVGYNFRVIDNRIEPKYLYSFQSEDKKKKSSGVTYSKGDFLFEPRPTHPSFDDGNMTIVEGQLDAAHAAVLGIRNIASTGGSDLSKKNIERLKGRGFTSITLIPDVEKEKDDPEEETRKQNAVTATHRKIIDRIRDAGLKAYVSMLPEEGEPRMKMDVDSFLCSPKYSVKDLYDLIHKGALKGTSYLFLRILKSYERLKSFQDGELSAKQKEEFKSETIQLILSTNDSSEKQNIIDYFEKYAGLGELTKQDFEDEVQRTSEREASIRRNRATREALSSISSLMDEGKTDEAIKRMSEESDRLNEQRREDKLEKYLHIKTKEEWEESFHNRRDGLRFPITLMDRNFEKEQFILPSGFLSLICALPSQGKSTFLQNLALYTAQHNEGSVLYFTLEEDENSILIQMESKYIGETLSRNNRRSLDKFKRKNVMDFFSRSIKSDEANFRRKDNEFMCKFLYSGKLILKEAPANSDELIEIIEYLLSKKNINSVFVDYIQLLRKKGYNQKNEMFAEICEDFKNLAKRHNIPVVMAAQLNREAKSPAEMTMQNTAESADIERGAALMAMLWDSTFLPLNKSEYETNKREEKSRLEGKGLKLGESGKMYIKLCKNRFGLANAEAVLDYEKNIGVITDPSFREEDFKEEEPSLFQEEEDDDEIEPGVFTEGDVPF